MRTLHVACRWDGDVLKGLSYDRIKFRRIGLITTVQHLHQLDGVKKVLKSKGKKVLIGGQVLGCNLENAIKIEKKVDCFLYVGSGRFHPLGVAMATEKPVFVLDNKLEKIGKQEIEKWKKRQKGRIARAVGAQTYGVIISTRDGQLNLKEALRLNKKLGERALLFAGDNVTSDNLLPFRVDAWINTGCPRLVDDHFDRPMLNPGELDAF